MMAWCGLSVSMAVPMHADMSLDELADLPGDSIPAAAAILSARTSLLRETAMFLGSLKGTSDRAAQLMTALEARTEGLDKLYRFSALVTRHGVLPPVITEARDVVQATNEQVRV